MATKVLAIKLTKTGRKFGPFRIEDQTGNVIANNVTLATLIRGQSYIVDVSVLFITIISLSDCSASVTRSVANLTIEQYISTEITSPTTACLWTHLIDHTIYNSFYK